MASGGPTLSYNPSPQEQPYYEGLFTAADVRRSGSLGGAEAVQFFARSKLPMDTLKSIWSLADQPVSNSLDRRKFAVAVRLIQLAQNGQRGDGPHLGAPPGVALKPVYFEGVTGVTLQPPPPAAAAAAAPLATPSSPPHGAPQPQPPYTPNANALQTPPRPQTVAASSSALTVQDPYTLSPQDQARYEAIYPQYETDGYVQGKEAVALFSKSGLPQPVLREIWNMVDDPVDNRLDKLEFAMAMHLIVCVSKKNLPMPPQLPTSLKALKSQQQAAASTAMQQHSPMQQPPPSPSIQRVPTMESHTSAPSTNAMQPPPGVGGMSISDAFEGLDVSGRGGGPSLAGDASWGGAPSAAATGMGSFGAGGAPSMGGGSLGGGGGAPPPQSMGSLGGHAFSNPPHAAIETVLPSPSSKSHTSPLTIPDVPSEDVHSRSGRRKSKSRSKSRSRSPSHRSDADSELVKLKTVMQKLQAENISLKAQLGNLDEDEKSVRGEIGDAMAEIGRLSKELTQLRAQVLSAKAKLLEATAELKNAHEKRDAIKDLITETRATKEAIDEAYAGIEGAVEAGHHQQQGQTAPEVAAAAAAPAAVNESFTTDLFGFDAPAEQPAAMGDFGSAAPSQGSGDWSSSLPPPQEQPAAVPRAPEPQPYQPPPQPQSEPAPGHSRRVSEGGFDSEGMGMGAYSVAAPLKPSEPPTPMPNSIPEASTTQESVSADTLKNIEELKEQAKAAEELARDAEETRRQLFAQADELRRVADKAEVQAREAKSQADDKKNKGGVFGGKKKKKDQKAVDKAQQEATESRKKFLEIQSQANDAREVATDTKREAEKLRKQVEEAELEAAAAASMAEQQKQQQQQQQPQNGGYNAQSYSAPAPAAPTYGQPPPPQMQAPSLPQPPPPPQMQAPSLPQYGGGQAPSNNSFGQQMGGGFGASNDGYGFAAGVMGSGGGADAFSIPSPTEAGVQNYSMPAAAATTGDDDPFANPF